MKSRFTHPATLVLVIIALGFGLQLFHLNAQSFWYDEAYSAQVARADDQTRHETCGSDVSPSRLSRNRVTSTNRAAACGLIRLRARA